MKKQIIAVSLLLVAAFAIPTGCKKEESSRNNSENNVSVARGTHANQYSSEIAQKWMKMQLQIMKTTAGISNLAFVRPLAYSSIAFYESVLPGMPSYQTLVGQLNGLPAMPEVTNNLMYHWGSSANAAIGRAAHQPGNERAAPSAT